MNKEKIKHINGQIRGIYKGINSTENYPEKLYTIKELYKLSLLQIRGLLWRQGSVINRQRKKTTELRLWIVDLLKEKKELLKNR